MACMAQVIYSIFEDMAHLSNLPEEQKAHVLRLYADGLVAAKQEISYVKNTLESALKTLTTVVELRRHS